MKILPPRTVRRIPIQSANKHLTKYPTSRKPNNKIAINQCIRVFILVPEKVLISRGQRACKSADNSHRKAEYRNHSFPDIEVSRNKITVLNAQSTMHIAGVDIEKKQHYISIYPCSKGIVRYPIPLLIVHTVTNFRRAPFTLNLTSLSHVEHGTFQVFMNSISQSFCCLLP